jgi:hypothetical protein
VINIQDMLFEHEKARIAITEAEIERFLIDFAMHIR